MSVTQKQSIAIPELISSKSKCAKKRVALYIRVSKKEQLENYSMGTQAERLKKFCKDNNYLYRIYRENGESGFNTDRPAFQQMMQDAELGKFNMVVVDKIDRLCRNLCDLTQIHKIFDELGIAIKSLSEPIDTTTQYCKYFLYMNGMFAEMERDWFRERSKKGKEARFREGKWKGGTTPLGYSYNPETGKLEINEKEAETIKLIFQKYLKFGTMRMVVNWLNENERSTRTGAIWQDSTIGAIISRRTYIGIIEMNGETYGDEELRIIDDKLFHKTQELRDKRRRFSPMKRKSKQDPYGIYSQIFQEL